MQFNPSDKSISIVGDIDFLLWGTSASLNTEYSLVDRTRAVNIALDDAVADLHRADPNYKWDDTTNIDFPVATLNITANLPDYVLIDSASVVWRVRFKDANGTMKTLKSVLKSELSDGELKATGSPRKYYKIGGAVFPVPIPDYGATDGVELTFQRGANHFDSDDTDATAGFNSRFHQYLPVSAAKRYALANGLDKKVAMLDIMLEKISKDIIEHYNRRSPDDRTRFKLKVNTRNYGLNREFKHHGF